MTDFLLAQRRARKKKISTITMIVWLGWLAIFCGFEGAALWRKQTRVPWTTLSEFTWDVEVYPAMRWTVLIGMAVLNMHLVSGWPGKGKPGQ